MTVELITSSQTWTCPVGVYSVVIECIGAGGGGATDVMLGSGGGGGGGGAYSAGTLAVVPGTGYAITVGTGSAGSAGGDTYFDAGADVLAKGGAGTGTVTGAAGGAAAGCVGTTKRSGGAGDNGQGGAGGVGGGGGGGAGDTGDGGSASLQGGGIGNSPGGDGGGGGNAGANGSVGNAYGGGGGGSGEGGAASGGAGSSGLVRLTYDSTAGSTVNQLPIQRTYRNVAPRNLTSFAQADVFGHEITTAPIVPVKHSPDKPKPIPAQGRWWHDYNFGPVADSALAPTLAPFKHSPDRPKPIPAQGRTEYALDHAQLVPDIRGANIVQIPDRGKDALPVRHFVGDMPIMDDHYGPSSHVVGLTQSPLPMRAAPRHHRHLETVDLQGVLADLPAPDAFLVQQFQPVRLANPRNLTRQTDAADKLQYDERTYYASFTAPVARPKPSGFPGRGRSETPRDTLELMLDEVRVCLSVVTARPGRIPGRSVLSTAGTGNEASAIIAAAGQQPSVAVDVVLGQAVSSGTAGRGADAGFGGAFQSHRTYAAPPWIACANIAVPGPYWVVAGQVSPAAGAVDGDARAGGSS